MKTEDTEEIDLAGFETPEDDFDTAATTDEQPPVDDADFQDVTDEIDTDVFGEEQPAEAPAKKKVNWFNIGVAVVAVVVAGGLIWSKLGPQLMGGGDQPMPMASGPVAGGPAATKADSEAAAMAAVGNNVANSQGGDLLQNPDQFSNLNQSPVPTLADSGPAADNGDPFSALGDAPAVPMPTPISGSPEPAAVDRAVAQAAPVMPVEAAPPAPQPVLTQAQPEPQAAPIMQTSSNDSPDLKGKVTTLEQKLEALDSKVSMAIEQMGNVQTAAAPVDDARLASIQNSLERLEARLDDISSKRASAPIAVSDNGDVAPAPRKTAKKSVKAKSAPRSSDKWDAPYNEAQRVEASAKPSKANGWEMRGAKTGSAVIAKGSDLREVSVGENVPGLGEITGIASINGRWVVQGTQGRLSQ